MRRRRWRLRDLLYIIFYSVLSRSLPPCVCVCACLCLNQHSNTLNAIRIRTHSVRTHTDTIAHSKSNKIVHNENVYTQTDGCYSSDFQSGIRVSRTPPHKVRSRYCCCCCYCRVFLHFSLSLSFSASSLFFSSSVCGLSTMTMLRRRLWFLFAAVDVCAFQTQRANDREADVFWPDYLRWCECCAIWFLFNNSAIRSHSRDALCASMRAHSMGVSVSVGYTEPFGIVCLSDGPIC